LEVRTTGHLFQDRFRSENVETTRYLLTVTRYIHQNPIKAGIVKQVDEWRWSSCPGYYDKVIYPKELLDCHYILRMFSDDITISKDRFKEFNERISHDDHCLDDRVKKIRPPDEEARLQIRNVLGTMEIAQVKSLPKAERNEVLRKVKEIKGLSLRQAARIIALKRSAEAREPSLCLP